MTKRGFSSLGIVNCKNPHNAGGILRAAGCYKSDLIVFSGPRRIRSFGGLAADTQKAWRHIPSVMAEDVFDAIPFNTIPIAVDLVPDAQPLQTFIHPERGFYIFGPEDGTLGRSITERCKHKIYIPTSYCMNLAATVNVVLYDRMMKRGESYMPSIERAA